MQGSNHEPQIASLYFNRLSSWKIIKFCTDKEIFYKSTFSLFISKVAVSHITFDAIYFSPVLLSLSLHYHSCFNLQVIKMNLKYTCLCVFFDRISFWWNWDHLRETGSPDSKPTKGTSQETSITSNIE